MFELLEKLTGSTDFMPHGDCLVWYPELLWLHVGSDIIIGLAYYCIAIVIFYFVFKRRDIPYLWMSLLFGAFIFLCGNTHLMAAWTVYVPSYWGEGYVKLVTAVVSIITAILLIPLMPRILSLPSLNQALEKISQLNTELEQRVDHLQREVIKREQAEQAWHESEKEFRQLVEASPVPTVVTVENEDVVYLNNKFTELFGYNLDEIPNVAKWWPLAYPDDEYRQEIKKQWYARLQQAAKTRTEIMPLEAKITCKDGSVRHILFRGSFIGEKLIVILNDITELRQAAEEKARLESQLRQAQKMEAIGTLAGGIAHDFNNILTPILGYTDLVLQDLEPDSKVRSKLEEVAKAGDRAKELVKQILAFSRQAEHDREPIQLHPIIKEALKLLRSSIPSTIEIRQNINSNCGQVLADPTQIHQVLMNLCTNAYHAMRDTGGVLGVCLDEVEIGPEDYISNLSLQLGKYLKLAVSDTGTGIHKNIMDRIFEPYFTTKKKGEGTGMGLAVVHGIVKSHNGHITVYSEPGKGTTFHIYLPEIETKGVKEKIIAAAPMPTGKERVMIVDDEEQIVMLVKEMLEKLHYRVTALTSSIEALQTFRENPADFDLVITDMTMPNMTGSELTKELLQIRDDIPVILCTGFSEIINGDRAKAIGIRKFIMKPILMRDLAESVRNVLDSND